MLRIKIPLLLLFSCTPLCAAQLTVFTNGRVLTVDSKFSISDAIAIEGERVVALGEQAKALAKSKPDATTVDLRGRMLMPGLMDSHSHPVSAAITEFDHPIPNIEDIPQLLEYIAARAKALPEGSLIGIGQVFITRLKEQRYPTREEL
jgi:predicted amidohydrolase YtcJ